MGQEISATHFKHYDFDRFDKLVEREMELLQSWFREQRFSTKRSIAGLELEAWLVDAAGQPTPWNAQVIALAGSDDVVPELSRFNLEFNVSPQPLAGRGIAALATELDQIWRQTERAANQLGTSVVAVGVLPTLTDPMLSLANMSRSHRYQALNEQVLRLRQGSPIRLEISGRDTLFAEHRDLMLEAATTSFQLHLQVPMHEAVRYYNASIVASAALVAIASNSPFLFGKQLWEETRIPLFEQAVDVGWGSHRRVTFGSNYAQESLEGVFQENQLHYPVLLPLAMDDLSERVAHVRLQNGTIWRWNRPLIGFDDDGTPHLRIEHRVMSAGPTLLDMTANMALYYGLAENLAHEEQPPESALPFSSALDNFYRAARYGLECEIRWLDRANHSLRKLLLDEILPRAALGLQRLKVDEKLAGELLAVIDARARTGQTGAVWQRRFVEQHGRDWAALTQAYRERQQSNEPVHSWTLDRRVATSAAPIRRSMLRIIERLPYGMLDVCTTDLANLLEGPTLIHLPGRRAEPLFVSILLHGNEDVGLLAVQAWLRKQETSPLPRALSILIGNVAAARANVRHLRNQPDYNRVWPGADDDGTPEHAMMRHVVAEMCERHVFACIDLHNNTGLNPHYACVTKLNDVNLQLAALFGRTAIYFQRPHGVAAAAFAELCASVTCECGQVGDESGVRHATEFLDACLHLAEFPQRPVAKGDLYLFRTVATLFVPSRIDFAFVDSEADSPSAAVDLALRGDLDLLNFQQLKAGTCLGWLKSSQSSPLYVVDQFGRNVTSEFLTFDGGCIRLRRSVTPSMLTRSEAVIRQDCLGYFMDSDPQFGSVT